MTLLNQSRSPTGSPHRAGKRRRRARRQYLVERLEERRLLASLFYQGTGADELIMVESDFYDSQWCHKVTSRDRDTREFIGGTDEVCGALTRVEIWGAGGDDEIHAADTGATIWGGDGSDLVFGGDGVDMLEGGAGRDILIGGYGADVLKPGSIDGPAKGSLCSLGFFFGGAPIRILHEFAYGGHGDDLFVGGAGNDLLMSDEGNDTFYGGDGDDVLAGGPEVDSLYGGSGNDMLFGQEGSDRLRGGPGADVVDSQFPSALVWSVAVASGTIHVRITPARSHDASIPPLGWNVMCWMSSPWPSNDAITSPVRTSQRRTKLSSVPAAIIDPSGE